MSIDEDTPPQTPASPAAAGTPRWIWLALAGVMCLAALLRFWGLGSESIWRDEGTSIHLAKMGVAELLADRAGFGHAPLYFLLLRGWTRLFGDSELSVRTPSAVFGLLAVLATFFAARELLRKPLPGLLAALLVAGSLFHVEYSQEARMYSLCALLALASMYFFVRLMRGGGAACWTGYLLAAVLLVWTHPSGWSILVVQNAAVLLRRWAAGRPLAPGLAGWFAAQALVVVLFAPWLWAMATHDSGLPLSGQLSFSKLRNSLKGHAGGYPLLSFYLLAIGAYFRFRLRSAAARSAPGARAWILRHGRALLLVGWWLGPLLMLAVMSGLFATRIMDRYTAVGTLGMFVLAGAGVARLPRNYLRVAALAGFALLTALPLAEYYSRPQKEQWREAAAYVAAEAKAGEPVLFLMYRADWYIASCFDYYARGSDLRKEHFPITVKEIDGRPKKFLSERMRKHPRLWVVLLSGRSWTKKLRLAREAGYLERPTPAFHGIRVCRFERAPNPPPPVASPGLKTPAGP